MQAPRLDSGAERFRLKVDRTLPTPDALEVMYERWGLVDCRIPVRGRPRYALLPESHDGGSATTHAGALWSGRVKLFQRRSWSAAKLLELAKGEPWLVVGNPKATLMDPRGQKRAHVEFGRFGVERISLSPGPQLAFLWLGTAQGMRRDYMGGKLHVWSGSSGVLLQKPVGIWRMTRPSGVTRFRDHELEAEVSTSDPPLPIDVLALFGSYLLLLSRAWISQLG